MSWPTQQRLSRTDVSATTNTLPLRARTRLVAEKLVQRGYLAVQVFDGVGRNAALLECILKCEEIYACKLGPTDLGQLAAGIQAARQLETQILRAHGWRNRGI